jgi:hypothetical protein
MERDDACGESVDIRSAPETPESGCAARQVFSRRAYWDSQNE